MEYDHACFEIVDNADFLRVIPIKLKYKDADNEWDKSWLETQIEVKAGAFKGKFVSLLQITDLNYFKSGIEHLYTHLDGELLFEDLEGYLKIIIKGDGNGHFELICTVCDHPGHKPTKLSFYLDFDQTQIMQMVRELNYISKAE